jgi:hypothetical protein
MDLGKEKCPYCKEDVNFGASRCNHCAGIIRRRLSFLLFIGILFFPAFFAWFTLRSGHSPISRVFAFGYLFFLLFVVFGGLGLLVSA